MESQQVRVIEVVPYTPKWREDFLLEAEKLRSILSDEIINIYHIGSTSILGLSAKPVIDVMIEVADINNIDQYNQAMENSDYIPRGEYGISGRRFFLRGLYARTHHVHIFQTGSREIAKHLNFRDYMIAHPDEAKAYGVLKNKLAEKFRHDINAYCDGKDAFIKEMDRRAAKWVRTGCDGSI